ncbi:25317_t:CDS:1, partial [Gigaspora margarita]
QNIANAQIVSILLLDLLSSYTDFAESEQEVLAFHIVTPSEIAMLPMVGQSQKLSLQYVE